MNRFAITTRRAFTEGFYKFCLGQMKDKNPSMVARAINKELFHQVPGHLRGLFKVIVAASVKVSKGTATPALIHVMNRLEGSEDWSCAKVQAGWWLLNKLNHAEGEPRVLLEGGRMYVEREKGVDQLWQGISLHDLKYMRPRLTFTPNLGRLLTKLFGEPDHYEKRGGDFAKLISRARMDNEQIQSEELSVLLDNLEGQLDESREDMAVMVATLELEAAQEKKLRLEADRLSRKKEK